MSTRAMSLILLLVAATVAAGAPADAQILNTLSVFHEEEPGVHLGAAIGFEVQGGNTELLSLDGGAEVEWITGRERFRLLADGAWERSEGEDLEQATTVHLRHNHRLSPWLRTVAFAQHQRNPFQKLSRRFLLGAGLRADVIRRPSARLSVGITPMAEIERLAGGAEDEVARLSTFLVAGVRLGGRASIESTAFFQPRLDDAEDLRALANVALRTTVVTGVELVWSGEVAHDSRPPEEVEETDWSLTTGLALSY